MNPPATGQARRWTRRALFLLLGVAFALLVGWGLLERERGRASNPRRAAALVEADHGRGRVISSAGFLARSRPPIGFVVTSSDVLDAAVPRLRVKFAGTERWLTARLAGVDLSSGIAVLEVQDDELPAPIDREVTPQERLRVRAFVEDGEPVAGAIVQTGLNEYGDFEVDIGLGERQAGAAVVDERGSLVGVLVERRGEQRTRAARADLVGKTFRGRVASGTIRQTNQDHGDELLRFAVRAELLDPLHMIERVSFMYVRSEAGSSPRAQQAVEGWGGPVAPSMQEVPLGLDSTSAVGEFTLPDPGVDLEYHTQLRYTRRDGSVVHTGPDMLEARTMRTRGRGPEIR